MRSGHQGDHPRSIVRRGAGQQLIVRRAVRPTCIVRPRFIVPGCVRDVTPGVREVRSLLVPHSDLSLLRRQPAGPEGLHHQISAGTTQTGLAGVDFGTSARKR